MENTVRSSHVPKIGDRLTCRVEGVDIATYGAQAQVRITAIDPGMGVPQYLAVGVDKFEGFSAWVFVSLLSAPED